MTINEAISLLALSRPVSHEAVKQSFRRLVKIYHPDKHFTDVARDNAAAQFVQIKAASELLLDLTEEEINNPRPVIHRQRPNIVRRERPYQAPPQVNLHHPIIKEIENIVRLFRLTGATQIHVFLRKLLIDGKYSPSAWMGSLYTRLFEKKYAGEEKLDGAAYAVFFFFKLLWGAVFLIASFFTIAILGLILMVLLFPPVALFAIFYSMYMWLLKPVKNHLNKTIRPNDRASWLKARFTYLIFRTLPLPALFMFSFWFIEICNQGTYYVSTISKLLFALFVLLLLSVVYEWIHFFKAKLSKN
jgi:hypothetical protein